MTKLSKTQTDALREIQQSVSGRLVFGYGFGRYNVALRALLLRPEALVTRRVIATNEEEWALTEAGRAALSLEQGETAP